jgi:cellulose synthase (UDP-forming)
LLFGRLEQAQGFYILTLFSGLLYSLTLLTIIWRHYAEDGWRPFAAPRALAVHAFTMVAVVALFGTATAMRSTEGAYALAIGLEPLQIVDVKTRIAGAGSASQSPFEYSFTFRLDRIADNATANSAN